LTGFPIRFVRSDSLRTVKGFKTASGCIFIGSHPSSWTIKQMMLTDVTHLSLILLFCQFFQNILPTPILLPLFHLPPERTSNFFLFRSPAPFVQNVMDPSPLSFSDSFKEKNDCKNVKKEAGVPDLSRNRNNFVEDALEKTNPLGHALHRNDFTQGYLPARILFQPFANERLTIACTYLSKYKFIDIVICGYI